MSDRSARPRLHAPLAWGMAAVIVLVAGAAGPARACRFWALIGSGYPQDMIDEHLRSGTIETLKHLSDANHDGWGFGSFLAEPLCLNEPLQRRGRPAANWYSEAEYDKAVDELTCLRPRACLGHIRAGGTGHWGIPDPHPFQQERWIFAQNGSTEVEILDSLLTWDDLHYLNDHPPEYVNGYIDSELFFLYLLKIAHQGPWSFEEALVRAVSDIAWANGKDNRMNFVLTAGDTLYALRYAPNDSLDPVVYYPAPGASDYYVVASKILGSTLMGWGTFPPRSLGVFVPGQEPRFIPIDDPASAPEPRGSTDGWDAGTGGTGSGIRFGPPMPNPSRGAVRLAVRLPAPSLVSLDIWDASGRSVRSVPASMGGAGLGEITWSGLDERGRPAAAGSYFYRIRAGGRQESGRFTLVR